MELHPPVSLRQGWFAGAHSLGHSFLLQNSKAKVRVSSCETCKKITLNSHLCKPSCNLVSPYLKHPIRHKPQNLLAFMYLWLWWSTRIHVEAANDSLNPGDTLNFIAGVLCSKKVTYCLGFTPFTGGENIYLVVVSNKSVEVWTKNQTVDKDSAVLSLNRSRVLKIESQRGKPIILYSSPKVINNTKATLLDTKNFVLQQLHPNGTNTLVADAFSLEWEHVEQELIIRRRGKVCWRSGKLRNNRFEYILEDAQRRLKYTLLSV
ncbi:hypothetical protein V8G54_022957, partial [Vigna mungo]